MKMIWMCGLGVLVGFIAGWTWADLPRFLPERVPEATADTDLRLMRYTIDNLGKRSYRSQIVLDEVTATGDDFFVQKFHFDSDGKNVSGLSHVPMGCNKCPVIIQIRGYAEQANYQSGFGTRRSAERFVQAGFISLAPDFLGYAGSASPSADVFEERFEKYVAILNLLEAVKNWDKADGRIGIWGHSNGGQIALTVLEITGGDYPTSLWAPVTAGFPYSILYYMEDNGDGDRELRAKLFEFETSYDAGQFNLLNYLDRINTSVLIHQGLADISVPREWSRNIVTMLRDLNKDVRYHEYDEADHNLIPDWSDVVQRDISFYKERLTRGSVNGL